MLIKQISNLSNSGELTVTKSIGSLLFASTFAPQDLAGHKISIFIERANGSNEILANKVGVLDFMVLSSYGNEALQSDGILNFSTIAVCELALDGAIFLGEKESIKISLENLDSGEEYALYGIEHPVSTNEVFVYQQKSLAVEDTNKKIDVRGYDLCVMSLHSSINDVSYGFDNGQVVKYLPTELICLSMNNDPIAYVGGNTVNNRFSSVVALPLVHVDYIEVNKSQGNIINFLMRSIKSI